MPKYAEELKTQTASVRVDLELRARLINVVRARRKATGEAYSVARLFREALEEKCDREEARAAALKATG